MNRNAAAALLEPASCSRGMPARYFAAPPPLTPFGFTDEARRRTAQEKIVLLEAGDFTTFLLTSKLRDTVRAKLKLPLGFVESSST
jgi:hypothetical protein